MTSPDDIRPSSPFPLDQFSPSGLLWKINHEILHPHGLALAVEGYPIPPKFPIEGVEPEIGLRLAIMRGYDSFEPKVNRAKAVQFEQWIDVVQRGLDVIGKQT